MSNHQAPGAESDFDKYQKPNKSKSSIRSGQGNPFHKPPSPEKPNGSNKSTKSQGDGQEEKQKQAEQQAQDKARRQEEERREAEEELQHQLAQQGQQRADEEARRLKKQQQKQAGEVARLLEQQRQQQQQRNDSFPPNLSNLNIDQPNDTIADIVPVDMIFLRLRPETNAIDEALLTLPLESIQRLDSRIERFDFSRRSNTGHRNIGVLQTLSRMKGLPVTPGYNGVRGAKEGEQWEPAEGGLDTLREVLIGQLRRVQDLERWEPRPIHIKCYLRYFRPGDPEDGASTRMHAEIVRKLQGVGDLKDVMDRTWERWVSDGPPGEIRNFRKFGYREEGEDLECRAPGKWETMYWIEGALPRKSRFYTEMKGRKTQADEGGWNGLVSKRVPSPPRFMDPVKGRNGKPKKKPARDSGVGMGDDVEAAEEEDEEARREKARWQREQDENARKQREGRKKEKEAGATEQGQNKNDGWDRNELEKAIQASIDDEEKRPKREAELARINEKQNGFGGDGSAKDRRPEETVDDVELTRQVQAELDAKQAREAADASYAERMQDELWAKAPSEVDTETAAGQPTSGETNPETQQTIIHDAQTQAQRDKEAAEAAQRKERAKGKRPPPVEEKEVTGERPQKKPKFVDGTPDENARRQGRSI